MKGNRSEGSAVYTIENFSFSYPGISGFNRKVSINGKIKISRGEKVLIKGPSGCGKSTLLLAMAGIIPEEIYGKLEGKILFKGKNILDYKPEVLHKHIGIVFQNPYTQRITPSIEDELVFYMENLGFSRSEIKKKFNYIVEKFSLHHLLNKDPKNLSGGEIQKIMLASVLVINPDVLLLDEPSSYLDVKAEIQLYKYLKNFSKDRSIVLIDHRLNHNISLVNRIIELDENGNITFDGNVENYTKKIKTFTRETRLIPAVPGVDILNNLRPKNNKFKVYVKNLSFSYSKNNFDDRLLLKNINLTLEPGKVTTIFGLNGSGKTTLLKIIARIIKVKNSVYINSKEYTNVKDFYKNIGIVLQNPESHFLFQSISKEIGNGKDINNPENWLKGFSLPHDKDQNPFTLSEGEKRRLNLSSMIFLKRTILLMDEPTFGQDELNRRKLAYIILKMKENGFGFLIVSHDKSFIKKVSDKVYLLKNGVLVELKRIAKSGVIL